MIKLLLAIISLPICIGVGKSLIMQIYSIKELSAQQFYFLIGFTSYLIIQAAFFRPIRTYIFGHELTHAFWSIFFGGKVKEFNVSKKGGNVLLTKTNFFVNLAPYFFPIYTFIVLLIFFGVGIFVDVKPYASYMIFLVGFTLSFHLILTSNSLTTKQPDIVKTGIFFSLVVILIINIITVTLILKIITPEKIYMVKFFKDSLNITLGVWSWIVTQIKRII